MLEYFHEFLRSRDSLFTVPTFDPISRGLQGINFYFRVTLSRARKEREIVKRDYLGRIVISKVSSIPIWYNYYHE